MAGSRRAPLVVAGVVGILLIVAVKSFTGGDGDGSSPKAGATRNADGCTVVHLTASSEKAALLKQLAADWNGKVDGGCGRVEVTSKSSGGAADALARGWDDAVDGVRPDVWSPAASSWTQLLRQKTTALDKPDLVGDAKQPSIVNSPLVIAMPKPMATALGWPKKALGWGDVLRLAQD